jgi:SOS-response transcriptional repressor LexA
MDILTLEMPKDLLALLRKRASERGQEPQEEALRILKKELTPEAKSERERVIQALEDSGLIRPLSSDLRKKYVRCLDPIERERIRQELAKKTFTPSPSSLPTMICWKQPKLRECPPRIQTCTCRRLLWITKPSSASRFMPNC